MSNLNQLWNAALGELTNLGQWGSAYLAIALIGLVVLTAVLNGMTAHDDEHEIETLGSEALGIQRSAQYKAYFLGVTGSLFAPRGSGYWNSLGFFALDCLLVIILLAASTKLADWYLLRGVDNTKRMLGGNISVAQAERGNYPGVGLIMAAAFAGTDQNPWVGFANAALFWLLGEFTFAVFYRAANWLIPTDYEAEILRGNVGAGHEVGAYLFGLGIIQAASIAGPATTPSEDIVTYLVAAVPGSLLLLIAAWAADLLILRKTETGRRVHHNRIGVGLTVGGVLVGSALVIAGSILGQSVNLLG